MVATLALDRCVTRLISTPITRPSRSITAICASPFAVMSPMLSVSLEKDL